MGGCVNWLGLLVVAGVLLREAKRLSERQRATVTAVTVVSAALPFVGMLVATVLLVAFFNDIQAESAAERQEELASGAARFMWVTPVAWCASMLGLVVATALLFVARVQPR